ncbi:MBL fold metallo-hydrolase [Haloechinothrix sp. YIM 98757]|uniref:MBL fold metallo-hydrolase n=1 Tax=Haloechinothrix aidingensis TaxID=2752311 RepID=A0A838ABI7_9PSEU|nr:MBL fold metallo-hydrolase [Haloechinothrix aidingensis]
MTTKLVLLGTAGGPTPHGHRFSPAQAIVVDGAAYVFDCGNGVAHQLARAGIPFSAIRAVFVTHNHSDHNADIGSLLMLGWSGLRSPVRIIGPPPIETMVKQVLEGHRYDLDLRVADEGRRPLHEMLDITESSGGGVVYTDEHVTVTATLVDHPPVDPAFGFRIDTADRSIVISGDTVPCDNLVELATGADVLVHETMHVPALDGLLSRHNGSRVREHLLASHTRSDEVGPVAERAGVPLLVLSHLTPADGSVDDAVWQREAEKGFSGTVVVGQDLQEL